MFRFKATDREDGDKPEFVSTENPNLKENVRSYLHDFVFGLVGILLIFMFVFRIVVVSGPSMQQTLMNGDCVLLLSNTLYQKPEAGDIVVLSKQSYKNGEPIIKRVIATEGQVVDIDFSNGTVYVDGIALDEPYISTPTVNSEGIIFPITVKEDCIFVMGDNRSNSSDSRSTEIGQIDCREIIGKALFLALPAMDNSSGKRDLSRIGVL